MPTTGWIAPAAVLGALAGSLALAPSSTAEDHTVVEGDTLFDLARHFDVSVAEMRSWNALSSEATLHPGDVLHTSTPVSAEEAASAEHAAVSTEPPVGTTYEVTVGDTLWAIAQARGTTVEAIYAANRTRSSIRGRRSSSSLPRRWPPCRRSRAWPGRGALGQARAATRAAHRSRRRAGTQRDEDHRDRACAGRPGAWYRDRAGRGDGGIRLRNLPGGDRDSLGLFQQRVSTGWGIPEHITDPEHNIRAFFLGVAGPEGPTALGLLEIEGWESLPFTDAAQAVQLSAYPLRYGA